MMATQSPPRLQVLVGDPDAGVDALPAEIRAYRERYPLTVRDIASVWGRSPLPTDTQVQEVEIYYQDYSPQGPSLVIAGEQLVDFHFEAPADSGVTKIAVNGKWAYIEIGGKIYVDRLNGIQLPKVQPTSSEVLKIAFAASGRKGRQVMQAK